MNTISLACLLVCAALGPRLAAQEPPSNVEPKQPSGLLVNSAGAAEGYVLYAPLRSGHTFVVDRAGQIVHEWKHGLPTMTNTLLDNGHLLVLVRLDDNPVFFGGGIGGRLIEFDWDGNIVWDYTLSNEKQILHHTFKVLPNGHVLVIAWERHVRDEAAALGRDPSAVGDPGWWTDAVLELEPVRPGGAKVVWEWHMSDHLVQDFDRAQANFGSPLDRAGRFDVNYDLRTQPLMSPEELARQKEREQAMRQLGYAGGDDPDAPADAKKEDKDAEDPRAKAREKGDWTHVNSVDYDPQHDLILLSSPELCEIFVIDHSATSAQARTDSGGRYGKGGDALWRWGNPRNWGAGSAKDQQLFYQHQPEWIPPGLPGAGHVLVFNNGSHRPGGEYSSVDELVLPFDAEKGFAREARQPFGPAAAAWSYAAKKRDEFFSFFISGCQRLSNGNTLICSGQQGRLFEVTPQHEIVWEFWNPWGGELEASMGKASPKKNSGKPSPVRPTSVFRATKLAADHPGLKGRKLVPREDEKSPTGF